MSRFTFSAVPAGHYFMLVVSDCCSVERTAGLWHARQRTVLSVVLPLAVSISFFLIADIDSPRAGVIRIQPQNLYVLAESLKAQ
jgi:hypothetical protein